MASQGDACQPWDLAGDSPDQIQLDLGSTRPQAVGKPSVLPALVFSGMRCSGTWLPLSPGVRDLRQEGLGATSAWEHPTNHP